MRNFYPIVGSNLILRHALRFKKEIVLSFSRIELSGVVLLIDQEEIHNQCHSEDPKERMRALEELKSFFSYIPDKLKAWNDLVKLANNEDRELRDYTAEALGSAFFIFQINKKHGMIYID